MALITTILLSPARHILALLGFGLVALIAIVVHRLVFHPLANVPGPFFAKISGIPSWYHAVLGHRHIWLWQLYQEYGPRFRIDPNTVLFCDYDAYNTIYSTQANVKKSSLYTAMQRNHREQNTLTVVSPEVHSRKRKLLNLAFTESSLRASSDFMIRHIDRWLYLIAQQCSDEWSPPQDFSKLVKGLVFDLMGDLAFGRSFDTKEPGTSPIKKMPEIIEQFSLFWYPIARSPLRPLILWLRPRGLDAMMEKMAPPEFVDFSRFVQESIDTRLKLQKDQVQKPETEQRLDMFHFLCEAKDPDTGKPAYSYDELRAEANLLIIAGTDTTSVSLSGTIFYLVHDPVRLEKLKHEIRSTFATADEIVPGQKLQSCAYLRACMDEGMRLSPPGPGEMDREVCEGGITINGDHYPAGVIVGVSSWLQTRTGVYGDPYAYRPERWIPDEANGVTAESIARCRSNFYAFAKGPYSCAGKNVAILEMSLTLARTLHQFDVRMAPGNNLGGGSGDHPPGRHDPSIFQMRDAFVGIVEGPMVQFRRRGL